MSYSGYEHQLRSYIAPAAPATRAPCDGTESTLRVEFGFTPKWFRQHCAIDLSERWHLDPRYRRASVLEMCRILNQRVPALALGGAEPEARPANLDGVHGALVKSMLFGISATYYADNWPAARHDHLSADEVVALRPPDIASTPVFQQNQKQMDLIEADHGRIEGYLNWQGVLNTAYRLRGQDIFMDMAAAPEVARHLFSVVTETMVAGMRSTYARQAQSGFTVRHATVSNCMVNMISPAQYREFLLPCDREISEAFAHFGIHNCAWNADPYVADYGSIEKLGYVDMGIESDLARAKRACPTARRALMYTPTDLVNKSMAAIREDLLRIRHDYSPCDIVLADIEAGTPDKRVLEFAALARELEETE